MLTKKKAVENYTLIPNARDFTAEIKVVTIILFLLLDL